HRWTWWGGDWGCLPPWACWWWWCACWPVSTGWSRCWHSASEPSPPPRRADPWCSRCAVPTGPPGRPAPARAVLSGWRGFVGRANGGMVVHIGVVVVAIGLAAATSYLQRGRLHLTQGQTASFAGHTVEFEGTRVVTSP